MTRLFGGRFIAIALAACLAAISTPMSISAAADGLADAFAGDWRGSGMVRPTPDDAFEAVRCRISAEPGAGEDQVTVEGRCASANRAGRFSIDVRQTGSDAVTAALFVYDQNQTTNFSGTRSGNRIEMASSQPMTLGGVRYLLDLTIELGDDRLVMQESATPLAGGARTRILEITFGRE